MRLLAHFINCNRYPIRESEIQKFVPTSSEDFSNDYGLQSARKHHLEPPLLANQACHSSLTLSNLRSSDRFL